MRLVLSFLAALLVALALFGLMIVLIMPPRDDRESTAELARISFVRSVGDSSSDTRERNSREAPEQPQVQPETPPLPVPTPQQPMASTNVSLNIDIPTIQTGVAISGTPSLDGLTARDLAAGAAAPASSAAAGASGGEPSLSEEVTPLNDIPPNYPQRALAAGIEGAVTLAFTITPEGRVDNLRVTDAKPPGVFDREARRAASRWRFAPRRENGQAVAREATKTLYFRLNERGR